MFEVSKIEEVVIGMESETLFEVEIVFTLAILVLMPIVLNVTISNIESMKVAPKILEVKKKPPEQFANANSRRLAIK